LGDGVDARRLHTVCTQSSVWVGCVYDFGGGTFDISVLKLISTDQGDFISALGRGGDTHLGGR